LEQWTIFFKDKDKSKTKPVKEQYIIKVRFSPELSELIEFEVELNPIPVDDFQGKDVVVNWKMMNGFDPAGKFWTDSNGLEMI
jgi:hypothetical protein